MRALPLLALVALLAAGCTRTVITTPTWSLARVSLLQRVTLPTLTVGTNGTLTALGYANDGGAEAVAKITAAAIAAAIGAAK